MSQETNLNVTPYFDDFDGEKNYHRILFRPSFPIQARELTQLQSILQNQIERFGQNIYKTGTVISGCSVSIDHLYNFVKLKDVDVAGFDVNVNQFQDCIVTDPDTGLKAVIVNVVDGLESSANGDLKTIYVKYVAAGSDPDQNFFANGSDLVVQSRNATVERFVINDGSTGYNNAHFVYAVQTSPTPTVNAYGRLVTNSAGGITSVVVINKGEGYTKSASEITTTIVDANGVPVVGTANIGVVNYIAQPIVAPNGTGLGYGLKVSDGIIFQKGFFVRVEAQEVIVSKYLSSANGHPNNVSVGFSTEETIVNSSVDSTLLDNASGFTNFQAPGADRLKLTPRLVVKATSDLSEVANGIPTVENFFTLVEFQNGRIVRDKTSTQFNSVNTELAKRTFEESGDYVLSTIALTTEEAGDVYNATYGNTINVIVGRGVAYIQGQRNELVNPIRLGIPKANTTLTISGQNLTTAYGNYVLVNQEKLFGLANIQYNDTLTLFANTVSVGDTGLMQPGASVPADLPSSLGTTKVIGTAKVRSVLYNGFEGSISENKYRIYLYDIEINSGFSASDIQSIGANSKFLAEVYSNDGVVINDSINEPLLFPLDVKALSSVANPEFQFRQQNVVTANTTGGFIVESADGQQFLYTTGTLSETQKQDFVIVAKGDIYSANLSGTYNVAANGYLTRTAGTLDLETTFGAYKDYGLHVRVANASYSYTYPVIAVISNTVIRIPSYANVSMVGANIAFSYPNNSIINPKLVNVTASATATNTEYLFQLTPWEGTGTGGDVCVVATAEATPSTTILEYQSHYVKIASDLANTLPNGPWCLGIPNAVKLEGVWAGTGNTFADEATSPNIKDSFVLISGQQDSYYGLSYVGLQPGSVFKTNPDGEDARNLLIKVSCFKPTSKYDYITTSSYKLSGGATPAPVQDIPVYRSRAGKIISLRDAIDFRVFVSNTVAYATTAGTANTVNTGNYSTRTTETINIDNAPLKVPSPIGTYEADVTFFVPRRDKVVMDREGNVKVIQGLPALKPQTPQTPPGTMSIGELIIPPYPSLAYHKAVETGRYDYAIGTSTKQQRRFTMADIEQILKRVETLEYYASFSLLESQTASLRITSEANTELERFKNGFFVDPMKDTGFADTTKLTFEIDDVNQIATPLFDKYPLRLRVSNTFQTTILDNIDNDSSHAFLELSTTQSIARFDKPTNQKNLVENFVRYRGLLTVNPPYDVTVMEAGSESNYIRTRKITIYATGLMPNKKHYIFFDGVNITAQCRRAVPPATTSSSPVNSQWEWVSSFSSTQEGRWRRKRNSSGGSLYDNKGPSLINGWTAPELPPPPDEDQYFIASEDGRLAVQFRIPASTYTFGVKDIIVMDIDNLLNETSAVSIAKGIFTGFSQIIPQKPPIIVDTNPGGGGGGGGDGYCQPLQTESAAFIRAIYGEDVMLWAAENMTSCNSRWIGDTEFWTEIQNRLRGTGGSGSGTSNSVVTTTQNTSPTGTGGTGSTVPPPPSQTGEPNGQGGGGLVLEHSYYTDMK